MKKFVKKIALLMAAVVCLTAFGTSEAASAQAACGTVTIYFVDNTPEQWVSNDNAVIELVDNTYGHDKYIMTTTDNRVWKAVVPTTAYNITFNRCNSSRTVLWNSWSAGGRDGSVIYVAEGNSNGEWTNNVNYIK